MPCAAARLSPQSLGGLYRKGHPHPTRADFFRLDRDLFLFGKGSTTRFTRVASLLMMKKPTAGSRLGSDGKVCRAGVRSPPDCESGPESPPLPSRGKQGTAFAVPRAITSIRSRGRSHQMSPEKRLRWSPIKDGLSHPLAHPQEQTLRVSSPSVLPTDSSFRKGSDRPIPVGFSYHPGRLMTRKGAHRKTKEEKAPPGLIVRVGLLNQTGSARNQQPPVGF